MTDAQLAARTPLGAHQVEFHPVAAVLGEPQVCMVCPDCGPIAYVAARDVEDAAAGHLKFATELDRVGDAA